MKKVSKIRTLKEQRGPMTPSRGTYRTTDSSPAPRGSALEPRERTRGAHDTLTGGRGHLRSRESDPALGAAAVCPSPRGGAEPQRAAVSLPFPSVRRRPPRSRAVTGPVIATAVPSSFACFHVCHIFVSATRRHLINERSS